MHVIPRLAAAGRYSRPAALTSAVAGVIACTVVGGLTAAAVAALLLVTLWAFTRAFVLPDDRRWAADLVIGIVGLRFLGAALLHFALSGRGPYGALFLDDAGYVQIALSLADHWHARGAAPFIDPSFDHNYVKLAAAVFYLIGPSILALKLLNTVLASAAALLLYRTVIAAGWPGRRLSLGLMLVFPSVVLWSALALKDSYSLAFSMLAVWSVTEFVVSRRYLPWFLVTLAALLAIENVRAFLFILLVVAWPIALAIALPSRRMVPVGAAAIIAFLLLAITPALNYINPNIVTASVAVRQNMAAGAGSSFVAPLPVIRAQPCTLFVVTVAGRTPAPGAPRQRDVAVGDELVVEAPGRTPGPGQVLVRPGDIVAVAGATPCPVAVIPTSTPVTTPPTTPVPGSPGPPPTPTPRPTPVPTLPPVVVAPQARNIVSTPAPQTQDALAFSRDLMATLVHLPVGLLALLVSPFPPLARTWGELLAAPEMLVWYATLALALIGVRQLGAQARARFAYGLIASAMIATVLILFEGNLGTLVRHRAMVIPFAVALAGVGATWLGHWYISRR